MLINNAAYLYRSNGGCKVNQYSNAHLVVEIVGADSRVVLGSVVRLLKLEGGQRESNLCLGGWE